MFTWREISRPVPLIAVPSCSTLKSLIFVVWQGMLRFALCPNLYMQNLLFQCTGGSQYLKIKITFNILRLQKQLKLFFSKYPFIYAGKKSLSPPKFCRLLFSHKQQPLLVLEALWMIANFFFLFLLSKIYFYRFFFLFVWRWRNKKFSSIWFRLIVFVVDSEDFPW